ncbi:MAG TPA: rhomboid family intramembrane serine protease, partial [Saprospiraceae bacterium]|nr:rhomboid family intramembrane serine protease [Saprospiraceae bacterium]
SAGASGAIFGMFGLFYGWVTTSHRISSEEKKAQLASAGTFLAFNLFMGLSGKIDNAAHLGGLAAGIIIGLLVSKWHGAGAWRPVLTGSALALALAAVLIGNSTSDIKAFEGKMKEFSAIEESVLRQWAKAQADPDKQAAAQMYEASAAEWAKATAIAREVNGYKLTDNMHAFTVHLVDFCEKRGALLSLLQQAATNNSVEVQSAIDSVNSELEKVNAQMESLTK